MGFALSFPAQAQQGGTAAPSSAPFAPAGSSSVVDPDPALPLLREAFEALQNNQNDNALAKANAAIETNPKSLSAYVLRGSIYFKKKLWAQSEKDFLTAAQYDPKSSAIRFNLAEIKFAQKQYDAARPEYVALETDSEIGDLNSYKVFLCDLFGGHQDMAAKELAAFNAVGSNPSYYYANAAWSLVHKNTEDARSWLTSAVEIYTPQKNNYYSASLRDNGYLPLPPPPSGN